MRESLHRLSRLQGETLTSSSRRFQAQSCSKCVARLRHNVCAKVSCVVAIATGCAAVAVARARAAVAVGAGGEQSGVHIHRSTRTVACARLHRDRRPDVHVRRGRSEAPDLRHRVRRRPGAVCDAVHDLVVLTANEQSNDTNVTRPTLESLTRHFTDDSRSAASIAGCSSWRC